MLKKNQIELILRASTFGSVLLTWDIELHHNGSPTKIKLPKPIVIDPQFKYEIRLNMIEFMTYFELKSEIQLQNGTIVTFHDDPVVSGKTTGMIFKLEFNRVD